MINFEIKEIPLCFNTNSTLFSPKGLDAGTKAMLSCVDFQTSDKVLDLGCGYGVVGIYAAKIIGGNNVTMLDVDPNAVEAAIGNAALNDTAGINIIKSNGFESLEDSGYTLILSNPPYHTDFSIAKAFIEKGFNRLVVGGRMLMVTKRKDWYKNKFTAIFGGVSVKEIDGYFVFIAEKRSNSYNVKKRV